MDPTGVDHPPLLALALQHCCDGLIVIDDIGRVQFCNLAATTLLELGPALGAQPLFADLLSHLPIETAPIPVTGTSDIPFACGKVLEMTTSRFAGGAIVMCRDVTGARRAETQLADCQAKFGALEEKFNEVIGTVMREVAERQNRANDLAAAKTAAEAATEAKSIFLASMSHEVRTPLNGILGFTDLLLEDGNLDARSRQNVEKIRSAGHALLGVVNDILDFSEFETGGGTLSCDDFTLTALIDTTLEMIEPQAQRKHLSIERRIDPAIAPHLHGDKARLRQILLNILNNAVKFTEAGSIRMTVRGMESGDGAQTLHFEIADSGIGIPAEKHDRLFERFSQVDSSIRRKFGGTGLGLAISKQLVQLMGGEIGFDSTEGRGSVFWFTICLPIASGIVREDRIEPVTAIGGKRILLVEDIVLNSEIATAMLESAGYAVDVVADGRSAIAAVQRKGYDLVLMDIQMPDMDGITATRHIRNLDGPAAALPILAMTAHVIPREVERFLAAGMNDHIGKPFKRSALHAKLAQWCGPPALIQETATV